MHNKLPFISFSEFSARQEQSRKFGHGFSDFACSSYDQDEEEEDYGHLGDFEDQEFMRNFQAVLNFGLTVEEKEFIRSGSILDNLGAVVVVSSKEEKESMADIEDIGNDCELFEQSHFNDTFEDLIDEVTMQRCHTINVYGDDYIECAGDGKCGQSSCGFYKSGFCCPEDSYRTFVNVENLYTLEPILTAKRDRSVGDIIHDVCPVKLDQISINKFDRWREFNLFLSDEIFYEVERGKILFQEYYNRYVQSCLDIESSCSFAMMLHPVNLIAYMLKLGFSFKLGDVHWKMKIRKTFFYLLGLLGDGDDCNYDVNHFLNVTKFCVVEGFTKWHNGKYYFSLLMEICLLAFESNCGLQWSDGMLIVYNEFGDTVFGMNYCLSSQFDPMCENQWSKDPPRIGLSLLKTMKTFIEKGKIRSLNVPTNPWADSFSYHGPLKDYPEPLLLTGDRPVYDFVEDVVSDPTTVVLSIINQTQYMVSRYKTHGLPPLIVRWRDDVDNEIEHHVFTIVDAGVDYTFYVIKSLSADHLIIVKWKEFPGDHVAVRALSYNSNVPIYCKGTLAMDSKDNVEKPLMIRVPITVEEESSSDDEHGFMTES